MNAKIRNIFDVEFNKRFQGNLTIPFTPARLGHTSHSSRAQNLSYGTGGQKYLFFITDKYVPEARVEDD